MFRNQSANIHQFSMVPNANIPRSTFRVQHTHKTTFDAGYLIPIYVDEVLPGDTFKLNMTAFARMATPIFPLMDNLYLDSFFFFVPNRLLWTNFKKFMGEQASPIDSTSFLVPTCTTPAGGYPVGTLHDYMGLPTVGQMPGGATFTHANLHLRAYNLIWNEWFRDNNLQNSVIVDTGDGPDNPANYVLLRRGKRHDYFSASLPWPQKGYTGIGIPLQGQAAVKTSATELNTSGGAAATWRTTVGAIPTNDTALATFGGATKQGATSTTGANPALLPTNLYADLSTATNATINQLRTAVQIQRLLERDARGGTRYTERMRAHFGVQSPDARLQRPEYLGGGSSPISIVPIAQTSATGLTGGTTPTGNLAAVGTALANGHGFSQSFTEHGVILGLICARADLTYQQGVRKMWKRSTQYDFYFPAFANLGEQPLYNYEIYADGSAFDNQVFAYQERWAEYRYNPSKLTGLMRSTSAGTLDAWHLAQKFTGLPILNSTFIQETPPMDRVLAVPSQPDFICDTFFNAILTRPMPLYSVPELMDRF